MDADRRLVALVTGGSRGVGAAAALSLADRGSDVLITYRNKAARASEVANEVMQRGVRALPVGCDITKQEDRDRLFAILMEWSDHLDLLVLTRPVDWSAIWLRLIHSTRCASITMPSWPCSMGRCLSCRAALL